MKKILIFLPLILLVSLIAGCNTAQNPAPSPAPVIPIGGVAYFPNTDGYKWNYTYTAPGSSTSGTMSREFSGTQSVGSIACQKYIWKQDFAASSEVLAKVTTTDVKFYGSSTMPTTEATLWLSFPMQAGSFWTMQGTYAVSVEAYESITVPAGTYNAFRVLYNYGPSTQFHYWYAENVGIVAFEIFWVTQNITAEMTSKNF